MKKHVSILLGLMVIFSSLFTSCNNEDELDPNICKITVNSEGNGAVSITDYIGTSVNVLIGNQVEVVATPDDGWAFTGWYANGTETPISTDAAFTFTTSESVTLTARFAKLSDIIIRSGGNGRVAFKDATGNSIPVVPGTEVTVIATPNTDCDFVGWFVGDSETPISTEETYTFTVTESIILTGKFIKRLIVTIQSTGNGDATFKDHSGTSIAVLPNTDVTVIATPDEGYDFIGWYIDEVLVSTNQTFVYNVNDDVLLIAKFTERNLLENSDFEIWKNSVPVAWGQTVTFSTYSQSSEAHSGNYAVLINGSPSTSMRFASKGYTLKPGNYTLSTYIKKSGETLGQYRLGYAKLTNGVVANTQSDYVYITSATAVPTEWKKVSCNFTLKVETEVAINISNSKYGEGAAILIDDVTLTTRDGGLADGSEGSEEKPEAQGTTFFKETFATSLGAFTTQEVVGDFAWKFEKYNGKGYARVSGFANSASQDAESWLVSPAFDLSGATNAYIAFDYVINKGDASAAAANHKLVITNNYTGDVATTEWTEVNYGAVNNNDWNFHNTGKIALPESMMGQAAVVIAFKYMSTTANSSTWEIKNVVVAGRTGNTPETPENPGEEPENPDTPDNPGEEPDTPATEGGVFDFTNPEGLTPSVEAGSTQGAGVEASEYTFTNGNVTVKVSQGSATTPVRFWTRTGGDVELRTYKSSTITVSVSEGTMSSILFEGAKVSTMSADSGSFSAGTWSGNAQSVTFSVTGTLNIQKLTVK